MTACDPLGALRFELEKAGFVLRGGFHPTPDDGVPDRTDGRPTQTLLLVGNVGSRLWRRLREAPEAHNPDPFDAYGRRVLGRLAEEFDARAVFPGDGPPWLPFQRWAMRAEPGLRPSPLGILIHPVFGLWHAYRGALLFARRLPLETQPPLRSPCTECGPRPCLAACPAGAVTGTGYDVERCREHLLADPDGPCMRRGCLARHACPVGSPCTYDAAQAAHHMRAFTTPKADRVCPGTAPGRRDTVRHPRPAKPIPARPD